MRKLCRRSWISGRDSLPSTAGDSFAGDGVTALASNSPDGVWTICQLSAQRVQSRRRERSQGTPRALELVDFRQQRQQFRRDLDGVCFEHTGIYAGLCRIVYRENTG
jgi:hypothetical protein